MGLIHEAVGPFEIETRRESFIIHHDDLDGPHPEFMLSELGDLIAALRALSSEDAKGTGTDD